MEGCCEWQDGPKSREVEMSVASRNHFEGCVACGSVRLNAAGSNSSRPSGAGGFEPVPNWLTVWAGFTVSGGFGRELLCGTAAGTEFVVPVSIRGIAGIDGVEEGAVRIAGSATGMLGGVGSTGGTVAGA
jgi:hypothetical protein